MNTRDETVDDNDAQLLCGLQMIQQALKAKREESETQPTP